MNVLPKFRIYDDEQSTDGVFEWGASRNDIFEMYYHASDQFYAGEIVQAKQTLKKIIDQDEYFIDAYNLLGTLEIEEGNLQKGERYQQQAVKIGRRIIPDSFEGQIRWGFTENRPFLRALHAMGLNYISSNNYDLSLELFEEILAYNPDDNQGIRYLTGDLYFLQDRLKEAETVYQENINYPPYLYSYGLLNFSSGKEVKAISLFRRGIFQNIYISDLLRGKVPLIPYEIQHATNFEMPETSYSYLDLMAPKWSDYSGAIEMLQFLHQHEQTNNEIQRLYMLKNELYYANSGVTDEETTNARKMILDEIDKVRDSINESSSAKINDQWQDYTHTLGISRN